MPLSEVRPGMRGHGLTVFRGTTPERFDVEVVGTLRQFLPRQDLILIRMDHPLLEHSGTVGGMSGSPIYIDGRLIGALAYGWLFALDPIAGVTPIEAMLGELDRPLRPMPGVGAPLSRRPRAARAPLAQTSTYWRHFARSEGPTPAATPLLLGGFSARVRQMVGELLGDFGLFPVEAGGGGGELGQAGPRPFVPGGAIGVQLVRGDLSATGIGTVTTTRGDRVLAFGHPMFGHGQQHYPVTTARIVTILASRRRSFKFGEPLAEAGALIQDRQPCIIADTSRRGPMTKLVVQARSAGTSRRDRWQMEVVRERFLLPAFTATSIASALERFASDRTDLTLRARGTIRLAGRPPLTFEDQAFTSRGVQDRSALMGLRPIRALSTLLGNPFEPVQVEQIDLDVSLDFGRDEVEIIGAYVASEHPRAGRSLPIHVVLRPFEGPEEVRTVRLELPATAAGQEVVIHVTGGEAARPPQPEPQSLDDLIDNLGRDFSATSMVVTLQRRSPGVALRGHVALDLPPSALDTLRPLTSDTHEQPLAASTQVPVLLGRVVSGNANIRLEVER